MRAGTWYIVAIWICLASGVSGQNVLPPGTLLPVSLDHTLKARNAHPGQQIRAEIMQDIPRSHVRRRAHVIGSVVAVETPANGGAEVTLRFDAIEEHGRRIPITVSLRALASWMEVEQAKMPEQAMDRGTTPENATTAQIGGEQVYRGGGPVAAGDETVGTPVPYGVLGRPRPNRERGCREVVGDDGPQALWLFSTDACGVYGFPHLRILHEERSDPVGTIVLESDSAKLELPSGTGMLLRVQSAP